ncbi:TPA: AmmeMemoRadiSam system protein A [Candidatus Woesearchaeota archaeon]|nr:AmmeMemoRadiSam system protein A [Candidatus Woesearchaeota archaeon]
MLTAAQGQVLLDFARRAIIRALSHRTVSVAQVLREQFSGRQGVFVTLLKDGELRGSMGYPEGTYPLIDGIVRAARDAAFIDPRFKPVRKGEMRQLRIRIDLLSRFVQARISQLKPGRHGCYVEFGVFRGLQLPEDARKYKWTPKELVQNTLRKAGLAPEMWNDRNVKIYRFTTRQIEEKA